MSRTRAHGDRFPPLVCVTGASGAGKTTLLVSLIQELRRAGLQVAAIKHASHGFSMDRPGKDTWRLRRAGARQVAAVGAGEIALVASADAYGAQGPEPDPSVLARLLFRDVDLVLAEGFSFSSAPRIEVIAGPRKPARPGAGRLLAVVSRGGPEASIPSRPGRAGRGPRSPAGRGVPVFGADDAASLAGFLLNELGIGPAGGVRSEPRARPEAGEAARGARPEGASRER